MRECSLRKLCFCRSLKSFCSSTSTLYGNQQQRNSLLHIQRQKKDANRHFENSYSTRNAAINNRTGRLGELATASYIVFRIEQVVAVVNKTKQPTTEQYKSVKTAVSVVQCFREVKIHMATDTDQCRYVGYMAVQSDFLVPQQNRPQTRAYSQL